MACFGLSQYPYEIEKLFKTHLFAASISYSGMIAVYGRAKAGFRSLIVLAEWNDDGEIIALRCARIDDKTVKSDVYNTLKKAVECAIQSFV